MCSVQAKRTRPETQPLIKWAQIKVIAASEMRSPGVQVEVDWKNETRTGFALSRRRNTGGKKQPIRSLLEEPVGQLHPRNVPVGTNEKKKTSVASSSSSSSSRSNQHKLKLTARLPKLRLRPQRSPRIGFADYSALQELITSRPSCIPPPTASLTP